MNTQQATRTNQFFSGQRFWLHAKAVYAEKRRVFMWSFAIIAMIYSLVLLLFLSSSGEYEWFAQGTIYYMGLFITGFVFSARYYANYAKKGSALLALMQPVSAFEKWLLALITTLIVYPVVYTVIYAIMTYPVAVLTHIPRLTEMASDRPLFFLPFTHSAHHYYFTQLPYWLFYQSMCAYTLMASVFFKSLPLLKTFVLAFCLFLFFILMGINISPEMDLLFYYFANTRIGPVSGALSTQILVANILFWIVSSLFLWLASFYALKERELS